MQPIPAAQRAACVLHRSASTASSLEDSLQETGTNVVIPPPRNRNKCVAQEVSTAHFVDVFGLPPAFVRSLPEGTDELYESEVPSSESIPSAPGERLCQTG